MTKPQEIPIPQNFPVKWDSPEEATKFWTADLMHWPHGISPLAGTMDLPAFAAGLQQCGDELCMPFREMRFKVINGFVYNSVEPWSLDPDEMGKRMAEMQAQMGKHIPGLLDRWYNQYEPEVRSINEETLNGDYSKLGNEDISALLEKLVAKRQREGYLHFMAVFPAMGAVMFFEEVYKNLIGEPKGGEHLPLLQGFPNKSVEVGVRLWQLAQEARKRPGVLEVLRRVSPNQVHEALNESEDGRAFRGAVQEYLETYGWRAAELDIAQPTWVEQPGPVYHLIKEYAAHDDYNPEEEFRSLVAARQARENAVIQTISGGPEELFRQALSGAQQYLPVQEDHNFWIDQQGVCVQRVPIMEAGRRLAAVGRIEKAEDIFMLEYPELQDALRGGQGDLKQVIADRRHRLAEFRKAGAPEALGTMPPPEAMEQENPMFAKFFGAPPEKHPDPRIINGNAASSGSKTGIARVILTLDDSHRLQQGEILVCPATMPPWTPLFALASAVVTDHGGILSHTAIVAREYRIPAVVGTKIGTSVIADGQKITVDGTEGTVKLEA